MGSIRGLIISLALVQPFLASACSVFAVGKSATRDGSVLISHSDDGDPGLDARLIYVPAKDHPSGSQRPIFYSAETYPRYVGDARGPDYVADKDTFRKYNDTKPIGYIEQIPHTFGYQSSTYGVINEHGVGVAESTCGAMFGTCARGMSQFCEPGRKVGVALMSIDELSYIAMERCRTSREAVELMGKLALQYGFYGPGDSFEGSGESLIVGDPDEAWAFQILSDPNGTSAIWAAKRVPDSEMTVVANMYTIREVDPNDKDNYILSPNLFDAARDRGWWKDGQPFDFTKMYSGGEYSHKYYSGRRMWGAFHLAAPSVDRPTEYADIRYKPVYPWSVKPDKLVSHHDLMSWHRDWYKGTKFDLTKGLQAGPFGTPDRFGGGGGGSKIKGHWERSIALYRTNTVYVQQLKHDTPGQPKGLASVAWIGAGAAHYSPFVPVPAAVTQTLGPFHFANPGKFEDASLNWATRKISSICQIRFDHMHEVVEAAQQKVEREGDSLILSLKLANHTSPAMLNSAFEQHAQSVLKSWHALGSELMMKFSQDDWMGYSDAWLKGVAYEAGPPDIPTQDQCPPNCPHEHTLVV